MPPFIFSEYNYDRRNNYVVKGISVGFKAMIPVAKSPLTPDLNESRCGCKIATF
jgi:hypothetical protein